MLGCQMPGYGAQTMKAQGLEKKSSGVNVKPSTSVPAVVCMQPVSVQDSKFSMGNLLYFLGLFFFLLFFLFFFIQPVGLLMLGGLTVLSAKVALREVFFRMPLFEQ